MIVIVVDMFSVLLPVVLSSFRQVANQNVRTGGGRFLYFYN